MTERERERESPKRRLSQNTADFRRFAPSPGNSSIWRAQETAENCRFSQKTEVFFSQKTAGNRRFGSVTLGPPPLARPCAKGTVPGRRPLSPPQAPKGCSKIIQKKRTGCPPIEVTLRLCRGTVPGAPPAPYLRKSRPPPKNSKSLEK